MIMIKSKKITVVFQGYIDPIKLGSGATDGTDFLYNLAQTKAALPKAKIVLSTWNSFEFPADYNTAEKLGVDQLVLNTDPGGLPNIRFGFDAPNNANRQIASAAAGMALVDTKYALKLRADSFLTSDNLLKVYESYLNAVQRGAPALNSDTLTTKNKANKQKSKANKPKNKKTNSNKLGRKQNKKYSPIAVASFFTIDPSIYQHMAYHVSDWVQFGRRKVLQEYWSVKPMTKKNASYFENNDHDKEATFYDEQFRTRLAVEQHIAVKYAKARGYEVPSLYNETDESILEGHSKFLAEHFMVLDLDQIGLVFPKYDWVKEDEFAVINCVNHEDWYRLFSDYWQINAPDQNLLAAADQRQALKRSIADNVSVDQVTISQIYAQQS